MNDTILNDIRGHLARIEAHIVKADPGTDAVLEHVAGSRWTPAIVAGALIAAFAAGVWLGLKF